MVYRFGFQGCCPEPSPPPPPVETCRYYYTGQFPNLTVREFRRPNSFVWQKSGESYLYFYGLDLDESENSYAGGYNIFYTDPPITYEGYCLLSYDPDGNRRWRDYRPDQEPKFFQVVRTNGNIVVAASFFPYYTLRGSGYLNCYQTNGTHLWGYWFFYRDEGNGSEPPEGWPDYEMSAHDVQVDSNDNVIVAGHRIYTDPDHTRFVLFPGASSNGILFQFPPLHVEENEPYVERTKQHRIALDEANGYIYAIANMEGSTAGGIDQQAWIGRYAYDGNSITEAPGDGYPFRFITIDGETRYFESLWSIVFHDGFLYLMGTHLDDQGERSADIFRFPAASPDNTVGGWWSRYGGTTQAQPMVDPGGRYWWVESPGTGFSPIYMLQRGGQSREFMPADDYVEVVRVKQYCHNNDFWQGSDGQSGRPTGLAAYGFGHQDSTDDATIFSVPEKRVCALASSKGSEDWIYAGHVNRTNLTPQPTLQVRDKDGAVVWEDYSEAAIGFNDDYVGMCRVRLSTEYVSTLTQAWRDGAVYTSWVEHWDRITSIGQPVKHWAYQIDTSQSFPFDDLIPKDLYITRWGHTIVVGHTASTPYKRVFVKIPPDFPNFPIERQEFDAPAAYPDVRVERLGTMTRWNHFLLLEQSTNGGPNILSHFWYDRGDGDVVELNDVYPRSQIGPFPGNMFVDVPATTSLFEADAQYYMYMESPNGVIKFHEERPDDASDGYVSGMFAEPREYNELSGAVSDDGMVYIQSRGTPDSVRINFDGTKDPFFERAASQIYCTSRGLGHIYWQ